MIVGMAKKFMYQTTQRTSSSPSVIGYLLVALILSLVVSSTPFANARFTATTCVGTECIQRNAAGAWCYIPRPGLTRAASCSGAGQDQQFITVMEVHLAQSLSIAYYNGVDNSFLGGADYPIPAHPGIIHLCASGRSGDGNVQTVCTNADTDNQFKVYYLDDTYCHVLRGQNNVSDGCYDPKEVVQPSDSPTLTTSYASSGVARGSPTVTVTVTRGANGAQINTILMPLGTLFLAIMVVVAC